MKRTLTVLLVAALLLGMAPAALAEETVTLKWASSFASIISPNNDPVEQDIESVTGYKVEYTMMPQQAGNEKLFLEIASGVEYDIIKVPPTWYYELMAQNALMPITDLLAEYGQNIMAATTEDTWKLTSYNGEIYGVPQMAERPTVGNAIGYRGDILEALGLDMPATPEEFLETLRAVKAAYPDMVPFSSQANPWIPTIMSAFGVATKWAEVDGVLVNRMQMPKAKEYVAFLKTMYDEGLLDADFPILQKTVVMEKFTSGGAFAFSPFGYGDAELIRPVVMEAVEGATALVMDPLTGTDGERGVDASVRVNYINCIPRTSKHPEDAIKFMDAKLETDNFTFLTIGTEGETFTIDEEGRYFPIMPEFNTARNTAYWYLNGIDEYRYPDMWLARVRRNPSCGDVYDELNADFDTKAVFDPSVLKPTLVSFTEHETNADALIQDGILQIVAGAQDIDYFDTLVANWLAAGGQAMTDELNEWYESTKE